MNENKKTSAGGRNQTLATIITIIVVAAIFMVNVLVGFVSQRVSLRRDMTNAGLYTLSEDTKNILKNLTEDIRMYVVAAERDFRKLEASEMLDQYVAYGNGKVSVSYIDPLKQPDFTSRYNIVGALTDYSVVFVVESDKRYKIQDASEMYGFLTDEGGQQHVTSFNGESLVTSGILYVTKDELPLVSFITNHDEYYSDSLKNLLTYNGFSIEEVNLMTGDISPDSKLLFISSPLADFTSDEIKKLEGYFGSYRDAVVLYGLTGPRLDRFELFMKEWGVEFDMSIIFDPGSFVSDITQIAPYLENVEINKGLDITKPQIISQAVRPMIFSFTQNGNRSVMPVMSTSYTSFARPLNTEEFSQSATKIDTDIPGPFNIAALSTQRDFINNADGSISYPESQILTVASAPFILDQYMNNASIKNAEFISNSIKFLLGDELKEGDFYVKPKSISAARLQVYKGEDTVVVVVLAAIPLAVLIFGLVFWLKRRHL